LRASAAFAKASARCSGVNVGRANVVVLSSQVSAFAADGFSVRLLLQALASRLLPRPQ
jgi:hypothetical protein